MKYDIEKIPQERSSIILSINHITKILCNNKKKHFSIYANYQLNKRRTRTIIFSFRPINSRFSFEFQHDAIRQHGRHRAEEHPAPLTHCPLLGRRWISSPRRTCPDRSWTTAGCCPGLSLQAGHHHLPWFGTELWVVFVCAYAIIPFWKSLKWFRSFFLFVSFNNQFWGLSSS